MRNILVAVGSGIACGNTDRLADAFIEGARSAGHTATKIMIGKHIYACTGCGACRLGNGCLLKDDMQDVYPLFDECDTLVLASPIYIWTLSGQTKVFFDRLYAKFTDKMHPIRDTALLLTAGDDADDTFTFPTEYYRYVTTAIGWKYLGAYTAGGCKGGPGKHQISEEHLKAAYEFGKSLPDNQ